MSAANRSAGRTIHIYDANDPATVLGGLVLSSGVTNANFYSMVDIVFIFDRDYVLRDEGGTTVQKDDHPLQPGNYYILTDGRLLIQAGLPGEAVAESERLGSVSSNYEPWLVRTISVSSGTRVAAFRDAVRERDRQCAITGQRALNVRGEWTGFEAAHIFPLLHEHHWITHNYGRWITIQPDGGGSINSVQNGLLLRADVHALFDTYDLSINVDDNYKIVSFDGDRLGVSGLYLAQELLQDYRRPVDQLLRWHFRQAVLANVRGAGEPVFESDFPPGSDMIGEILSGQRAGERMEFELFSRLAVQ